MAVRQAALVSDESASEACACSRLCGIQIDNLYVYLCSRKCVGAVLKLFYRMLLDYEI